MKVLFIVPYSSEGPSNRYRVEQYLPYLKTEGIGYDVRPFIFKEFYEILYLKARYCKKALYFTRALYNRLTDVFKLYKYDLVFIHREACPLGPPVFEWLIHTFRKPIIFDFDDAIFLRDYHPANSIYQFLKCPFKIKGIIKMSAAVIVANGFLESYARRSNSNVHIIPTPIDTEKFKTSLKTSRRFTIGWMGSPTTAVYLKIIFGVMQSLGRKYDFVLRVIGAGEKICIPGVNVENCDWRLEKETLDLQGIDIGVYPLPDTPWARGKAGFKAIQYMACGIPVIASPVGITKEIIQDGINGFLANGEKEWIEKTSCLIENAGLRKEFGLAGRKTVEDKFSVRVNAPRYLEIIKQLKPCMGRV